MPMPTPSLRRASSRCNAPSGSFMMAVSVISSFRASGGSPVSDSTRATRPVRLGWDAWRAERFTETYRPRAPGSSARQRARVAAACSSTHWPMRRMSPVSSAMGMNRAGGTAPSVGCRQRTSASKPSSAGPSTANTGWYSRYSCLRRRARERSPSRVIISMVWRCMDWLNTRNRPLPWALAWYMAMSASRSNASAVSYPWVRRTMPMLADVRTTLAPMRTGRSSAASRRRVICTMRRGESTSSSSRANSSPPRRATVSPARTTGRMRRATSTSRLSPVVWPWLSLMNLNRSRSSISTAKR